MSKKILVWTKTNGVCFYCGKQTEIDPDARNRNAFVVDHLIPLAVDGPDELSNLVPCCRNCNGSKSGRSLESFRFLKQQKQIEKKYGARFTEKQEKALRKMNFEFPISKHVFWFEKQGIKIDYRLIDGYFEKAKLKKVTDETISLEFHRMMHKEGLKEDPQWDWVESTCLDTRERLYKEIEQGKV